MAEARVRVEGDGNPVLTPDSWEICENPRCERQFLACTGVALELDSSFLSGRTTGPCCSFECAWDVNDDAVFRRYG